MANWDNLSTRVVQEEMASLFEAGFWEGYEAAGRGDMLPAWCFTKAVGMLRPSERGYWFGREVRLQEMIDGSHSD